MTILVTGGAGYIGSHTVRQLRADGRGVVVLDTLELGDRRAVPADVELVVGDTADRPLVSKLLADHGVTACIHFAAYKNAGESVLAPGKYFTNNVTGSQQLLQALTEHGVEAVVFSSTCALYGTPDRPPVAEDALVQPENPYGESKYLVERMLRWYAQCHGLRSVSLRYFNAAGADPAGDLGEDLAFSLNLIPVAIGATLGKRPPLKVFGSDFPTRDGTGERDYIHVVDLADAHLRALAYLENGGATTSLNLGTGVGSTVREVLDTIGAIAGRPVPHEMVARRAGDPASVYADNRRAAAVLDWRPRYGLGEIIEHAWAWHSAHPDGWDG